MMYMLDLSGHDEIKRAGVTRFGGLFLTVEDAEAHGRTAAQIGRFVFEPAILWVRDQDNRVVRQISIQPQPTRKPTA